MHKLQSSVEALGIAEDLLQRLPTDQEVASRLAAATIRLAAWAETDPRRATTSRRQPASASCRNTVPRPASSPAQHLNQRRASPAFSRSRGFRSRNNDRPLSCMNDGLLEVTGGCRRRHGDETVVRVDEVSAVIHGQRGPGPVGWRWRCAERAGMNHDVLPCSADLLRDPSG